MRADVGVAVFCGLISVCQLIIKREEWTHSLWLHLLYNLPLFLVVDVGMANVLLLLCIILMSVPEGPVKRILSNVPWNWNFSRRLPCHIQDISLPSVVGAILYLTNCWSNWQICYIATSGQWGHTLGNIQQRTEAMETIEWNKLWDLTFFRILFKLFSCL